MRERIHISHIRPPVRFSSDEAETHAFVVKGVGEIASLAVQSDNEGDRVVHIFDSATVPDDGAVPLIRIPIAGGARIVGFEGSVPVLNGAVAVLSDTFDSLTKSEDLAWFYAIVSDEKTT